MLSVRNISIYFLIVALLLEGLQIISFDKLDYELYLGNLNILEAIGSKKLIASLIASLLFFLINMIFILPLYFYLKYINNDKFISSIIIYSFILAILAFIFSNINGAFFIFCYFSIVYFFLYIFVNVKFLKVKGFV